MSRMIPEQVAKQEADYVARDAGGDSGPSRLCGLIHRTAVRKLALGFAASTGRAAVITRVGDSVYHAAESAVRKCVRQAVHSHPSAFRTLEA